jgi:hypothetical protein
MEKNKLEGNKKSVKKTIFKIVFLLAIVLFLFFLHSIPLLVESYLIDSLKDMGLKNPRLTIRHVGLNQMDLRHLSLGDPGKPDLFIPSLAMDFSWLDLLKGKIRKIEITGLMLNVAIGKEGVTVKGLEPLFKNKKGGKQVLPVNRIDIGSSILQVDWGERKMLIPFKLWAEAADPGEIVTFAMDLTPYGETITVKGTLDPDPGDGMITITADNGDLAKYFSDFPLEVFQYLESRVQVAAEIKVHDWGMRDSRISLATQAFGAGFPWGNLKGTVELGFRLNPRWQPEDIGIKLRFARIDHQYPQIEIPFALDIDGSRLGALRFKFTGLSLQPPPGIRFKEFAGTVSVDDGNLQVEGSYDCGIDTGLVSRLFPALKLKGELEIKGNVRVLANDRGTTWNLEGKGRGKVSFFSKNVRAGMKNLVLSFASAGKGKGIRNNLDVELKGVEIKSGDLFFSAGNIFSQNTIEVAAGKIRAARGKLKITAAQVTQKDGIAAEGIHLDTPWRYPLAVKTGMKKITSNGQNPGNWGIASFKTGDLTIGKITGEVKQKEKGIEFFGTAQTPLETLKIKVTGTCQGLEDGTAASLYFEVPETQLPENSQLGRLHPALAGYRCVGYVSAVGTLSLLQGKWDSQARLKIRDLDLENESGEIKCRGMNTEITFKDLLDFQTGFSQRLDFKNINISGIQLQKGNLVFEMNSNGSLYIEGGEFAFGGGRILLQPFRFDLNGKDLQMTLYSDRIDFAEIVNVLLGDKIADGAAQISGRVTIDISDGIPVFREGDLYSIPGVGGNIKFIRSEAISGGVLLVEEAVKDFNYDWIKVKLETVNEKSNMIAFINGKPARKLPLTYDTKSKDIIRDKTGGHNLELKGLLLELHFKDIDLKNLIKGGAKIYLQKKKLP